MSLTTRGARGKRVETLFSCLSSSSFVALSFVHFIRALLMKRLLSVIRDRIDIDIVDDHCCGSPTQHARSIYRKHIQSKRIH